MIISRKRAAFTLSVLWLAGRAAVLGADLVLTSPFEYQVVQQTFSGEGQLEIAGNFEITSPDLVVFEAALDQNDNPSWRRLEVQISGSNFRARLSAPAGGWYPLSVRVRRGDEVVAQSAVAHVGVGEVFVVAGQSNAANHGEERQVTRTGRVAAFDGSTWRLANDPQSGASGQGGSFLPPFGDAIVEKFDIPVGLVPCAIGATSVREWLPKGAVFPNPPTLTGRVERLPSGEWASQGLAFEMLTSRMKQLGPGGFRAVLWHQGESDANQRDPERTLPGRLYRQYLEQLIRESGRVIGWNPPWFVAQVSYHVPGDEASPDIREAQAALWRNGVALKGPDTDALKGSYRDSGGQGVHLSGPGLRKHAALWVADVAPWLERERQRPGATSKASAAPWP